LDPFVFSVRNFTQSGWWQSIRKNLYQYLEYPKTIYIKEITRRLLPLLKVLVVPALISLPVFVFGQDSSHLEIASKLNPDSGIDNHLHVLTGKTQIDIIDLGIHIVHPDAPLRKEKEALKSGKVYASALPSVQYTLQTGFAAAVTGNFAFYTGEEADANISSVLASVNYSQKKQFFLPIEANIWTKGNKFNIQTDWQYSIFPQNTYGLGGFTTEQDGYPIDYTYVRLYQTLLKTVATDFYVGLGYDYDNYWNIMELNLPHDTTTAWDAYGFSHSSRSSGLTLNVLYDGRRNAINPVPGYYANMVLRSNFTQLGSDDNWTSLLIDLRKYMHFPANSQNTLAFWSYNWFTVAGKPPYLNLASTASDTYENLGRGYVQGRFRGQNLVYLETEYRIGITANGLLGGVVFGNAQSYTEPGNNRFETILPGYGIGIRIRVNKFSKTNVCLDYGFGNHGSRGIFANLGEIF
jgi:hypothetical protein